MTTPDPDRKSAPFEWRALTINKVEKIQLARLREEQDRVEQELREQEAFEREARRLEAREREREAAEQAWFDQGAEQPRDALEERDTHREAAVLTPLKRVVHSLTAVARRLANPPPKPRTSVPPPPLNESPVSISLVLAACAFGGSVYLSLRWVAEVRQANVTQQLTSSVNATAPVGGLPVGRSADGSPPDVGAALPSGAVPVGAQDVPSAPLSTQNDVANPNPASARTAPARALGSTAPGIAGAPAFKGERAYKVAPAPPATAEDAPQGPELVPGSAALPPGGSPPAVRSRVLVPASGSPHSSGTRVYRGGE